MCVTVGGVNNAVAKAAKVLDNDLSGDEALSLAVWIFFLKQCTTGKIFNNRKCTSSMTYPTKCAAGQICWIEC